MVTAEQVYAGSDVLLCVRPPERGRLRGAAVLGLLGPLPDPELAADLAGRDHRGEPGLLPGPLSRAQAMDALTSQANVAGYKAVLVAAKAYGGTSRC